MVEIPESVDAVRIRAISGEDVCATLAIQAPDVVSGLPIDAWLEHKIVRIFQCPFITSVEEVKRAFRRLTFTRQGTLIVRVRHQVRYSGS